MIVLPTYDDHTHTYRVDGNLIPHITEIVPSDYSQVPNVCGVPIGPKRVACRRNANDAIHRDSKLVGAHQYICMLEYARERGHAVHKATELYDAGVLNWATLHPAVEPYLEAWIKARKHFDLAPRRDEREFLLFHPIHRYAGRGDVRDDERIFEIKCIATMGPEVGLQTAAQMEAENYMRRNGLRVVTNPSEVKERWGIQLKKNGDFKPYPYTERSDLTVFLSYLRTLNWEIKHGKKKYAIQNV